MPIFDYNRVYQAYSGCDMVAHINHIPVGTLQALTVSITREVVPQYVMGDPNPKTYVKGKRGIAGTLVFSTFDRHALLNDIFLQVMEEDVDQNSWYKDNRYLESIVNKGQYYASDVNGTLMAMPAMQSARSETTDQDVQRVLDSWRQRKLKYSDELPPFNITLTMVNDFGAASTCHINGVVLINEGYGFTMDDLTNEISFTYVAREVTPLESLSSGMFTTPTGK